MDLYTLTGSLHIREMGNKLMVGNSQTGYLYQFTKSSQIFFKVVSQVGELERLLKIWKVPAVDEKYMIGFWGRLIREQILIGANDTNTGGMSLSLVYARPTVISKSKWIADPFGWTLTGPVSAYR